MGSAEFQFQRGRGLVWVCDLEGSTKLLNDDLMVAAMEEFLPRFHWLARAVVDAFGGQFIKWNGDGFLAWFPFELHREMGEKAQAIVDAAWHTTVLVNVTKLSVGSKLGFRVRHGIAIEHDALLTRISDGPTKANDLLGRGVVLAHRLSSMRAAFPCITAQREIRAALRRQGSPLVHFKNINLSRDDKLKYFKGEDWGTDGLCASCDRSPKVRSLASVLNKAKRAIQKAEASVTIEDPGRKRTTTLVLKLMNGPAWAQETIQEYARFIQNDLLGNLKSIVGTFSKSEENGDNRAANP